MWGPSLLVSRTFHFPGRALTCSGKLCNVLSGASFQRWKDANETRRRPHRPGLRCQSSAHSSDIPIFINWFPLPFIRPSQRDFLIPASQRRDQHIINTPPCTPPPACCFSSSMVWLLVVVAPTATVEHLLIDRPYVWHISFCYIF